VGAWPPFSTRPVRERSKEAGEHLLRVKKWCHDWSKAPAAEGLRGLQTAMGMYALLWRAPLIFVPSPYSGP
jgi:hypothetical protein